MRIICPTYWYPQHASDTQATYVHDINRHLVRRGHSVTVVTPGDPSLSREDTFDGVKIVRFPLNLPADLTYGRVAQSRVSFLGRFARVAVMANYLEAQYRAVMAEAPGREYRCNSRALGDPHRPGSGHGGPKAGSAQRHHHAWW